MFKTWVIVVISYVAPRVLVHFVRSYSKRTGSFLRHSIITIAHPEMQKKFYFSLFPTVIKAYDDITVIRHQAGMDI